MIEAEVILWSRLRGRDPDKPTFRRQHPLSGGRSPSRRSAGEVRRNPAGLSTDEAPSSQHVSLGG